MQARKVEKLKSTNPTGDTFKAVALEWYEKQAPHWSPAHADRSKRQLERNLFPGLVSADVKDVEPVELLAALRKVEERGAVETADRGLMLCRQIWRYGVATGRVDRDIAADLKGALSPYRGKHFAAITDPVKLGELLWAVQPTGAGLWYGRRCNWPRCCSSDLANCAARHGLKLTLKRHFGPSRLLA